MYGKFIILKYSFYNIIIYKSVKYKVSRDERCNNVLSIWILYYMYIIHIYYKVNKKVLQLTCVVLSIEEVMNAIS